MIAIKPVTLALKDLIMPIKDGIYFVIVTAKPLGLNGAQVLKVPMAYTSKIQLITTIYPAGNSMLFDEVLSILLNSFK